MKIYVSNLSYDLTEDYLRDMFSRFGEVLSVNIITDKHSRRPKGFAFVEMPRQSEAEAAIKALNESSVKGRNIKVNERLQRKPALWGKIVGKALVDGIDVCLEQVKAGFAWHYKKYQHEQSPEDQRLYANAEIKARTERLGLWRENNPNPPWEFRRLQRSQ